MTLFPHQTITNQFPAGKPEVTWVQRLARSNRAIILTRVAEPQETPIRRILAATRFGWPRVLPLATGTQAVSISPPSSLGYR